MMRAMMQWLHFKYGEKSNFNRAKRKNERKKLSTNYTDNQILASFRKKLQYLEHCNKAQQS